MKSISFTIKSPEESNEARALPTEHTLWSFVCIIVGISNSSSIYIGSSGRIVIEVVIWNCPILFFLFYTVPHVVKCVLWLSACQINRDKFQTLRSIKIQLIKEDKIQKIE